VSAVPFERLGEMLPKETVEASPLLRETCSISRIRRFHGASIAGSTGPRPSCRTSSSSTVSGNGSSTAARRRRGEHYLQVVVSAARRLESVGRDETERQVVEELPLAVPAASRRAAPASCGAITDRGRDIQCGAGRRSLATAAENRRWRDSTSPATGPRPAGRRRWRGAVRSGNLAAAAPDVRPRAVGWVESSRPTDWRSRPGNPLNHAANRWLSKTRPTLRAAAR